MKKGEKRTIISFDLLEQVCENVSGLYYAFDANSAIFVKSMSKFCGKEVTIKKVFKTFDLVEIEEIGGYVWAEWMFV